MTTGQKLIKIMEADKKNELAKILIEAGKIVSYVDNELNMLDKTEETKNQIKKVRAAQDALAEAFSSLFFFGEA